MTDAYDRADSPALERLRAERSALDDRVSDLVVDVHDLWRKAGRALDRGRVADARRLVGRLSARQEELRAVLCRKEGLSVEWVAEKWRVILDAADAPRQPEGAGAPRGEPGAV